MIMQPLITIPVIDTRLHFPQSAEMLTHDEIRDELIRQINGKEIAQIEVARHLCIAPARIAEIRNGKRRIQPDEMPKLAAFLGMTGEQARVDAIDEVTYIPNWGKVAQGMWLEQTEREADNVVAYDRRRTDPPPVDLFAVTPEGTSMNLRFPPGTHLICRKVPFGKGDYRPGDYVIVQRMAHNLHELTVKRVELDDKGDYWLHSESSDPKYADPWRIGKPSEDHHDDTEIRVLGRVVRAVQDFEYG